MVGCKKRKQRRGAKLYRSSRVLILVSEFPEFSLQSGVVTRIELPFENQHARTELPFEDQLAEIELPFEVQPIRGRKGAMS